MRRKRVVIVAPAHGGKKCGSDREISSCKHQPCPVNCAVSPWLGWSTCDMTCGNGKMTNTRMVLTQAENGGVACPSLTDVKVCQQGPCPVHCEVSPWSEWTKCSKSCGTGHRIRIRAIMQHPESGGYVCPSLRDSSTCNTKTCAVDCKVSGWGTWDNFVQGGNKLQRTRSVLVPARDGGLKCPALVEQKLNSDDCKESVTYGEWSKCTKACGSGHQWRRWERDVCSGQSVVKYTIKMTQGRVCNPEACRFAKDDVIVPVVIPSIAKVANALRLEEQIGKGM